jgi:hypothetical protein
VPDFSEAIAKMLGIIQPVAIGGNIDAENVAEHGREPEQITDDDAPLTLALNNFKVFTGNLNELTAPESNLSKSLAHIEDLSNQLTKNENITVTWPISEIAPRN